mmetsp:Transcript_40849/g.161829  ORF Transcript_40849/g.161829 Transcript_40849/m.161829 type:complete len:93 (+) Transcript_40849:704-982(+)
MADRHTLLSTQTSLSPELARTGKSCGVTPISLLKVLSSLDAEWFVSRCLKILAIRRGADEEKQISHFTLNSALSVKSGRPSGIYIYSGRVYP